VPAFVAIVGPTGAGKSELALALARRFDAEVVSCDALQVYRGLDIGTAKLGESQREGIPHHLIDEVSAREEFSAAEYVARAAPIVEDIARRGKLPIVVGGTGLYLRALRLGLFEGPGRSPEIRARLARIIRKRGAPALHRILARFDPELASRIHPNDGVRLVRGLEVFLASGSRMSDLMRDRRRPLEGFRDILIGLRLGRDEIASRVTRRVRSMFALGLVDEVRRLRAEFGDEAPAFKAIGYREVLLFLKGELDETQALSATVRATTQYAKRQLTWFRKEPGVQWFDGCGDDPEVQAAAAHHVRCRTSRTALTSLIVESGNETERLHAETAT
jgi:tRNA dimethylallyltransferase